MSGSQSLDPWGNALIDGVEPWFGPRSGYRITQADGSAVLLFHEDCGGTESAYRQAKKQAVVAKKPTSAKTGAGSARKRPANATPRASTSNKGHQPVAPTRRATRAQGKAPTYNEPHPRIRKVRFTQNPRFGVVGVTLGSASSGKSEGLHFLAGCGGCKGKNHESFSAAKYGAEHALYRAIESRLKWEVARYGVSHRMTAQDWMPIAMRCLTQFVFAGKPTRIDQLDVPGSFYEKDGVWHTKVGKRKAHFENAAYAHRSEARGACIRWCMQQGGDWDKALIKRCVSSDKPVSKTPRYWTRSLQKANGGRQYYVVYHVRPPGQAGPTGIGLYLGKVGEVTRRMETRAAAFADRCIEAWRDAQENGGELDLNAWHKAWRRRR